MHDDGMAGSLVDRFGLSCGVVWFGLVWFGLVWHNCGQDGRNLSSDTADRIKLFCGERGLT